jgi:hypothetical protein
VCQGNRIHCCFCANILPALFEYTGFALCIMQGANRVRGRYIFVQMTCNSIHNKSDRTPGALIKCTAQFVFSLSRCGRLFLSRGEKPVAQKVVMTCRHHERRKVGRARGMRPPKCSNPICIISLLFFSRPYTRQ